MTAPACEFFYDFASPYSYLAAMRVDAVLPVRPVWRPVSFGVIVQRLGKVPWSFAGDRRSDFDEIDRRAAERGLPPVRYPHGWPRETYSLAPLRVVGSAGCPPLPSAMRCSGAMIASRRLPQSRHFERQGPWPGEGRPRPLSPGRGYARPKDRPSQWE